MKFPKQNPIMESSAFHKKEHGSLIGGNGGGCLGYIIIASILIIGLILLYIFSN